MATTTLTNNSNRLLSNVFMRGAVSSVAFDAAIVEAFVFPAGFGQLLVENIQAIITGFSGAYVAPAPAFDGCNFDIQSQDATTTIDFLGSSRFVHIGTASGRPTLAAFIDCQRRTVIRQSDRIIVGAPVLAGAGVTGNVILYVRGERIMTG